MEELVKRIIELVGGKKNIISYTHCATRLRLRLEDSSIAKTNELKKVKGVITVVESGGQYQIVLGDIVVEVFEKMQMALGDIENSKESGSKKRFGNFLDITTSIFSPTIKALAAGGIIKGILSMLVALGLMDDTSGTYIILYAAANAIFYFYPVLLGYTSGKKFGIDPFIGMAIGAALVYPNIISAASGDSLYTIFTGSLLESKVQMEFLGIPVVLMNYSTSVIPVIVTTYFAGKVSELFGKVLPNLVKKVLLPSIVLAISVPLGILIIGPIVTWGCNGVGYIITSLFEISNVVTSAVLGFLWQPLVMFGLHKGLLPVAINNISVYGYDYIFPIASIAAYATAGSLLGIFAKAKRKSTKELSLSTFFQAVIASITEPAIYGLTIPLRKPFIASNIATAIGGIVLGIFNTKCYFMSTGSIFGAGAYVEPNGTFGSGFWGLIIAWIVVIISGFAITFFMGFDENDLGVEKDEIDNKVIEEKHDISKSQKIGSPVKGKILSMNDVNDEVFASKSLGEGIAIIPDEGKLYSPVDGKIQFVFETGHAIGILSNDGANILLHIGIDSAALKDVFKVLVSKDQEVKKGELLIEFDLRKLQEGAKDSSVIMTIVNSNDYLDVMPNNIETATLKDDILYLIARQDERRI